MTMLQTAAALVFTAFAAGIAPDTKITVDEWALKSRELGPDETKQEKAGKWQHENAPHLVEIMQCMSLSHPCREVVFKKSAQVGGTQAGINLFGAIACETPAPMIIVLPTDGEVNKYVQVKLQPAIDNSPALRARISEQKSRDNDGSTTRIKKFPGGTCVLTGATSSAGLQMISARVLLLEEVSEYPFDAGGRGDPVDQAYTRLTDYTKTYKVAWVSTPGEKGSCRISKKYEQTDMRRRYLPCPHCGMYQLLKRENLKWHAEVRPYRAHFDCMACGVEIEGRWQEWMLARGVWLKCFPGPDCPGDTIDLASVRFDDPFGHHGRDSGYREPGFALWQAYSLSVPWEETVHQKLESRGDPLKEKTYTQQREGEPWEARGDAPDYLKLYARRITELPRAIVPPDCLFLTGAADVQGKYLKWAVWGWGIGKKSWLIDHGVIPGDTSQLAAYAALDEVIKRRYANAAGRDFEVEAFAIDTGFNTQTVYAWARRHAYSGRVLAIDGRPGWHHLPLGTPVKVDVTYAGEKLKGGVMLWPVGTWQLKSEFYGFINVTLEGPQAGIFPPGYVHLPADGVDEEYCAQLTAEQLVTRERTDKRGNPVQEWVKSGPNENLDIRVYATAAAVHLGLNSMQPEQWQRLAAERGTAPEKAQRELALWHGLPVTTAEPVVAAPAAEDVTVARQYQPRHTQLRQRH